MYRKLCISRIYICMEWLDWVSFTEGGCQPFKQLVRLCIYTRTNTLESIIYMHINFPITRMTDIREYQEGWCGEHIKLDVLRDGIYTQYTTRYNFAIYDTHSPTRFPYSDNSNKVNECVDIIRTSRVQTCILFYFFVLQFTSFMRGYLCLCGFADVSFLSWLSCVYRQLLMQPSISNQTAHIPTHVLYHHLVLFMMVLGTNTPSYDAHAGTPNFMVFGVVVVFMTHRINTLCGWCSVAEWIHCCKIYIDDANAFLLLFVGGTR